MAEEKVFARKASGLVRGLSLMDTIGVGFMNQGLTPSIWIMMLTLAIYPGGSITWAVILSALLAGIGYTLVWGVLGGSMPRSGGSYIYNSRILHPAIGLAVSFCNAFVMLMWIWLLAPFIADPGLVWLFQFLGAPETGEFFGTPLGMFIVGTLANIFGFLVAVFGPKVFSVSQKILMAVGVLGTAVICLVFTFTSRDAFIAAWNAMAAQYGSLDYNGLITAVKDSGVDIPSKANFFDTLGVMVGGSWLFAYGYFITFIGGEVKRPEKSIILGNLFAVLIPAFFTLWLGLAMYQAVGFEFVSAGAVVDWEGELAGYSLPWLPHFIGLAAVITRNPILLALMAGSFCIFNLWWVALSYLSFPRIIFAWGMDRVGPTWFTDVNPRWASPVKNYILCFVLGELGIILYAFWNNPAASLSITGMQVVSVFGITALAAMLFPYVKKVRHIWEASPYRHWKVLGIPAVTIGGFVNLVYLAILFYFYVTAPDLEGLTGPSVIAYIIIWVIGLAWYYFYKWYNAREGIDVDLAYSELPPE
jgi:APA family basic amino acid/polyamine antiporter